MRQPANQFVNLIPRDRQERRVRGLCIRRWITAVVCTAFVVGIPSMYIGGSAAFSSAGITEQIQTTNNAYESNQREIPVLRSQLSKLSAQQEVYELVGNRIEWRAVFEKLIRSSGNRVRFSNLHAIGGGVEGNEKIEIYLDGFARTQSDARSYIVDLETTRIFDSIELIDTSRQEVDGHELIQFRVLITVESVGALPSGEVDDAG